MNFVSKTVSIFRSAVASCSLRLSVKHPTVLLKLVCFSAVSFLYLPITLLQQPNQLCACNDNGEICHRHFLPMQEGIEARGFATTNARAIWHFQARVGIYIVKSVCPWFMLMKHNMLHCSRFFSSCKSCRLVICGMLPCVLLQWIMFLFE